MWQRRSRGFLHKCQLLFEKYLIPCSHHLELSAAFVLCREGELGPFNSQKHFHMSKTLDLQKVEIPCELHINLEQVVVFEIWRLGAEIGAGKERSCSGTAGLCGLDSFRDLTISSCIKICVMGGN